MAKTKTYEVVEEKPSVQQELNMSIPQVAMQWSHFGEDLTTPRKVVVRERG